MQRSQRAALKRLSVADGHLLLHPGTISYDGSEDDDVEVVASNPLINAIADSSDDEGKEKNDDLPGLASGCVSSSSRFLSACVCVFVHVL